MATFRSQDGYAKPSKYEVIITPPTGYRGTNGTDKSTNIFNELLRGKGTDLVRHVSMETSQVAFPNMTLESQEDTNIYGPVRKIVTGQTFAELTTSVIYLLILKKEISLMIGKE